MKPMKDEANFQWTFSQVLRLALGAAVLVYLIIDFNQKNEYKKQIERLFASGRVEDVLDAIKANDAKFDSQRKKDEKFRMMLSIAESIDPKSPVLQRACLDFVNGTSDYRSTLALEVLDRHFPQDLAQWIELTDSPRNLASSIALHKLSAINFQDSRLVFDYYFRTDGSVSDRQSEKLLAALPFVDITDIIASLDAGPPLNTVSLVRLRRVFSSERLQKVGGYAPELMKRLGDSFTKAPYNDLNLLCSIALILLEKSPFSRDELTKILRGLPSERRDQVLAILKSDRRFNPDPSIR